MLTETWQMMLQKVDVGINCQMFPQVVQSEPVTFGCPMWIIVIP